MEDEATSVAPAGTTPKRAPYSQINTATMHTKFSIWTFNDKENKWYGVCAECKNEAAKRVKCSICNSTKPALDEE